MLRRLCLHAFLGDGRGRVSFESFESFESHMDEKHEEQRMSAFLEDGHINPLSSVVEG
jgi:hypothetical protein